MARHDLAQHRSSHRDDDDTEARTPSIPTIIALALVAIALALSCVSAAGFLLFGR